MFEFAYPWALAALLLLPLLVWYELRFRKRPSVITTSVLPFKALKRPRRLGFPFVCYLLAFAAAVIALARPRTGDEKVIVRTKGIDIVLALDMSGSMSAFDVPKRIGSARELAQAIQSGKVKNRLEVAKEEIRRFIESRPNDRIGLLGFADLAYSFSPPTLDHRWLLERLRTLEPGQIGDATGIASPIGAGVRRLKSSSAPRRVLVLFTDGTNTAENKLTPKQAAQLAKDFNVIIHTVGIGSGNAFVLAGGYLQPIQGSFDEALLREIAQLSGGSYFHAADDSGMKKVMAEINALEKTSMEQPKFMEYHEYAHIFALIACAFIALGVAAECTWKLRLP